MRSILTTCKHSASLFVRVPEIIKVCQVGLVHNVFLCLSIYVFGSEDIEPGGLYDISVNLS